MSYPMGPLGDWPRCSLNEVKGTIIRPHWARILQGSHGTAEASWVMLWNVALVKSLGSGPRKGGVMLKKHHGSSPISNCYIILPKWDEASKGRPELLIDFITCILEYNMHTRLTAVVAFCGVFVWVMWVMRSCTIHTYISRTSAALTRLHHSTPFFF